MQNVREPRRPPMAVSSQPVLAGVGRGKPAQSVTGSAVTSISQASFQTPSLAMGRGAASYVPFDSASVASAATSAVPGATGRMSAQDSRLRQMADEAQQRAALIQNAEGPYRQYEAEQQVLKGYIPGLHRPGENYPSLPAPRPYGVKPKRLPEQLIDDYNNHAKNEISCIYEYGSIMKLKVDFREVAVTDASAGHCAFACECEVGGRTFRQGVGKTKKDAKTNAARIAMDEVLKSGFGAQAATVDAGEAAGDGAASGTETEFSLNNKNEVSMLYELCGKRNWRIEAQTSDKKTQDSYFSCTLYINHQLCSVGYALNKKDAKTKAAAEALKKLLLRENVSSDLVQHWDKMASLVRNRVTWLMASVPPHVRGYNVLAAFIVKLRPDHDGEVVAIGTGDACITNEHLTTDGRAVLDSHAEVIARKALLKYFYRQIRSLYTNDGDQSDAIFEYNPASEKLRLKETISIHMYISRAPCGDAAAFPISDQPIVRADEIQRMNNGEHIPTFESEHHGQLRVKEEHGCVCIPFYRLPGLPTWTQIQAGEAKIRSMSCSDKILKWNMLGLQGSLLSQYLEPIYMSSLTLGSEYDHGHLARAICCRVADTLNCDLPAGYSLRHPFLGRVSIAEPSVTSTESRWLSINWCSDDQLPEIIDANTGRSIDESPFKTGSTCASRLCKAGFNFRFNSLARDTNNLQLVDSFTTYHDKKRASVDYFSAESRFIEYLEKTKYGQWVQKTGELERFSI